MSLELAAARESRSRLFTFAGITIGAADVAACVSGLLISSCFLRFQLFPLAWFAFAPLLWALARATDTRESVRLALIAGMTTNVPAFYWLIYTINVFGGFGYFLSTFFYLALSLYSSMQFVVLAVALRRTGFGPLALAPPLLWVTLEFLYPHLFPWRLGHSQFMAPVLIQIGDMTGPYGLSFVMLWFAAGLARIAIAPRDARPLVAASLAAVAVVVYGAFRLPAVDAAMQAAPSIKAALVQGNISIKEKGDFRYFHVNLDKYAELSVATQDDADLLVWPETVSQEWIPADATRLGKEMPFGQLKTHLYFGGLAYRLTGPRQADEFNSAFFVGPDGTVHGRYDKHILMPFGEYIPFEWLVPSVRQLSPATSSFKAGEGTQVFTVPGKYTFAPMICYEDLISDMSRRATAAGAQFLLNILNDAWYGYTAAPYEHQALALWRTVENRRYLLRGSNSGVTSIIDAAGRVVAEGGLFTAEVVSGEVRLMDMKTFYTRYGDLFAWFVVALAGVLLVRSGQPSQPGD